MRMLAQLFLASALLVCLLAFSRGRWEATLAAGKSTWIIKLPRSPAWSPPAIPSRDAFTSTFTDVPPSSSPVLLRFRLGSTFLDAARYLWAVTAAFGLVYILSRRSRRDRFLHAALCFGAAFTGAAIISIGLWIVFGGWGAPFPEFFAGLAIVIGLILSLTTYEPERA